MSTHYQIISTHVNVFYTQGMIEIAQLNCCTTPLSDADVISQHDAERMADLLKAVADPMRLRIISIISSLGGADVCACEFPDRLGISQPTASHHLKRLTEAGLLTREQRGKWAYFSLVPEQLEAISGFLRTPLPRS